MIAGAWVFAAGVLCVFGAGIMSDCPTARGQRAAWHLLVGGACVCVLGALVALVSVSGVGA